MYHILSLVFTTKELVGFAVLVVIALFWKGIALWTAARRSDSAWFIVLLIINTAGILELIYVTWAAHKKQAKTLGELLK